jgi:hypothetical protein
MIHFLSCRNCGRYTPAADIINRGYCSEECTRAYAICPNCGRAFPRGKGFDGEYCTRECTTRYQILRKYGPEPVTVITEV